MRKEVKLEHLRFEISPQFLKDHAWERDRFGLKPKKKHEGAIGPEKVVG